MFELKNIEISFMTRESDAKLGKELTCQFKIDMSNLTNFDPGTQKSQKFAFNGLPSTKCLSLQSTEESCLMALKIDAKFEGKLACASKNNMRNLADFYQSTQKF